jgi:DNA-directed RNA polymerase specialized sigma24 family protein
MRNPDQFDDFYKSARDRLLMQTYALTGDLPAARAGVRDAFVEAAHHWRKVTHSGSDPEDWIRPVAWRNAVRKHSARIWHKDKALDESLAATFEALGQLSLQQRKVLLLRHLVRLHLTDIAREVGQSQRVVQQELDEATERFETHRGERVTALPTLLVGLTQRGEGTQLPRPTIIRRAGTARRRVHTVVGIAAAMAVLGGAGIVVTQDDGDAASLAGERLIGSPTPGPAKASVPQPKLESDHLLEAEQVDRLAPSNSWGTPTTSSNTDEKTAALPCRQSRFADALAKASLVRTFPGKSTKKKPAATVIQISELSASETAAESGFTRTVDWYAGCADPRVQLISTQSVRGVGDEAMIFALRSWRSPVTTYSVGIARTGRVTTTTFGKLPGDGSAAMGPMSFVLSASINRLCGEPGTGTCAGSPKIRQIPPLPVGEVPAMLAEIDLPQVKGVGFGWSGTPPKKALLNDAKTGCDDTRFDKAPMKNNFTRTFLVDKRAKLDPLFGITETIGTLPSSRAAKKFVSGIRGRMSKCEDDVLSIEVTAGLDKPGAKQELAVWSLETELKNGKIVGSMMGIIRKGRAIAQVGFYSAPRASLTKADFEALVKRALDRLGRLPESKG